ncbi:hypothetical protein COD80_12615 [Bacillus cereus]|nr:hypothetical protein COD80_12615 [Bacillus cereus]PGY30256.1 hypothetical protein COE27_17225 [Bacillus cereus]
MLPLSYIFLYAKKIYLYILFFLYKGVKEYYFVKSVLCIEVDTGLLVFLILFGILRPFLNIS